MLISTTLGLQIKHVYRAWARSLWPIDIFSSCHSRENPCRAECSLWTVLCVHARRTEWRWGQFWNLAHPSCHKHFDCFDYRRQSVSKVRQEHPFSFRQERGEGATWKEGAEEDSATVSRRDLRRCCSSSRFFVFLFYFNLDRIPFLHWKENKEHYDFCSAR